MGVPTAVARPQARLGRSGGPRIGRAVRDYGFLAGLLFLLFVMFLPFLIITINAIKSPSEYASNGPLALPSGLYLTGIENFWNRVDFTTCLINSMVISLSVAILSTVLSLLNGFAMGIGRIRGSVWLLVFFMIANMMPNQAVAYPLLSCRRSSPRDVLDAARVDGCGKLQLLVRIVAPISKPSLLVFFAFSFIWTWNEFLPALDHASVQLEADRTDRDLGAARSELHGCHYHGVVGAARRAAVHPVLRVVPQNPAQASPGWVG